ncbi:hypothetical protein MHYP_G00078920 [Metynnis hypsauchen]
MSRLVWSPSYRLLFDHALLGDGLIGGSLPRERACDCANLAALSVPLNCADGRSLGSVAGCFTLPGYSGAPSASCCFRPAAHQPETSNLRP